MRANLYYVLSPVSYRKVSIAGPYLCDPFEEFSFPWGDEGGVEAKCATLVYNDIVYLHLIINVTNINYPRNIKNTYLYIGMCQ